VTRDGIRVAALLGATVVAAACLPSSLRSSSSEPAAGGASILQATASPSPPFDPKSTPSFVRPTPTPGPSFAVYVVKTGDNLTSIAKAFKTTARSIAFWNRDQYPTLNPEGTNYQPNEIKVGWELRILPGVILDEQTLPDPTPSPAPASS
jgi:hypothetical protein